MSQKTFKPSDFLRKRRPEQYSDSVALEEPTLNIPILEQHFLSITGHSEEPSFEYFDRKLLEKEVCPNLMPQVGLMWLPFSGQFSTKKNQNYVQYQSKQLPFRI